MQEKNIQKKHDEMGNSLAYFLAGAGIGAITALLFAPKAGSEVRSDIADVTKRGVDHARDTGRHLSDRANEVYQISVERASELAERGKELLHRQSGQLADAMKAGKEGYESASHSDQSRSFAAHN